MHEYTFIHVPYGAGHHVLNAMRTIKVRASSRAEAWKKANRQVRAY